ncbi:hypothetical protein ACUXGJ_002460, partial [Staphylococcus cohnii]
KSIRKYNATDVSISIADVLFLPFLRHLLSL